MLSYRSLMKKMDDDEKKARLAQALKANLGRRKAQARARAAAEDAAPLQSQDASHQPEANKK